MEILNQAIAYNENDKIDLEKLGLDTSQFSDEDDNFNSKFLLIFTPYDQISTDNLINTQYKWENNVFTIDLLSENKVIAKFKEKSDAINFLKNHTCDFTYIPPTPLVEDVNIQDQDISAAIPRLLNPKDEKLLLSSKWYKLVDERLDCLYLCRFAKNIEIRLVNFNKRLDLRHIICTKSKSVSKVNGGDVVGRNIIPYPEPGSNLADLESSIYEKKGVREQVRDSALNSEEISYEDQMNVAYKSVLARRSKDTTLRRVINDGQNQKYMIADLEEDKPQPQLLNSATNSNFRRRNNFNLTAQTLDRELDDYHSEFNKDQIFHAQPELELDAGGTDLDIIKRNLRLARKRKNREHLIDMNPRDSAYNLTRSDTPPPRLNKNKFQSENWGHYGPQGVRENRSRSPIDQFDEGFDLRQKLGRKKI